MSARLFVLTNWLGIAGAILVTVLICGMAFGKWKRRVAFRSMLWFSIVGLAIPIVLLSTRISGSDFFLVLWPSSLGLMGLNGNGSSVSELSSVAMLVVMNAGLYGLIGLIVGYTWQGLLRLHKGEK